MCLYSTSCSLPTSLHRTFSLLPAPGAGQQSSWSVLSPVAAAHGPQSCPAPCWAEVGETPAALCPGTGGTNRSSTSQDGIARSPRLPHTWKLPEQLFSLGRETANLQPLCLLGTQASCRGQVSSPTGLTLCHWAFLSSTVH